MTQVDSTVYLGGLVSNDGRVDSELSRRTGAAHGEFARLMQVWAHANLSRQQRSKFFQAFVLSKLRYGLCTT